MAYNLNYSAALHKARMDAITTAVGDAGKLHIFSGSQPSGPADADGTQVLSSPFTLGTPFAPGATSAIPSVLSPTLPSNVNASATIQPTWWRVKKSDNTTAVVDGSAGTSTCDMIIGSTTNGQPVAITAWTLTSYNNA